MKGLPMHDQRMTFRFPVRGFAVVHDREAVSRCKITNLSLGGALFRGHPFADLGHQISAEMAIAGIPAVSVHGPVVRCEKDPLGRKLFAIRFSAPSADTEDLIHDLSVMTLDPTVRPAIVIVDPLPSRRQALAQVLYQRGWRVLSVETPLQALTTLASEIQIHWVVVAQELSQTSSLDLLRHLAGEYPFIKCALLAPTEQTLVAKAARESRVVECVLSEPLSRNTLDRVGDWPPATQLGGTRQADHRRDELAICEPLDHDALT